MKKSRPCTYYVMTREQHDEMMKAISCEPTRWLYRSGTHEAANHMMRHYAQWFNDILVWNTERNRIGAMLSNTYPLQIDPVAPEIIEEYIEVRFRGPGTGRFEIVCRRTYVYPHPSSKYERGSKVHSQNQGADSDPTTSG